MLVPLTGAGAQARQLFDPKQPVCVVFPAQIPPQRCSPAGQPMPVPVLALADTLVLPALVLPALALLVVDVVVLVVVPLALVVPVPAALLVDVAPPAPPADGPGPSAALPPEPPSPSLVPPLSAAFAQP